MHRKALERDQCECNVVGAFVRHEIADQVAAAAGYDLDPAFRILLELRALERIELIADEYRHGHGELPDCRKPYTGLRDKNASVIIEA